MNEAFVVHTDVFDGPLDLLLHLVQREGIDLRALPMARVAAAYLEALDHMIELDLGIAGDHLVMAATLVHLKSLDLLPRAPMAVDDDAPDPRDVLVAQLKAHALLRSQADRLDGLQRVGRDVFLREPDVGDAGPRRVELGIDAFGLLAIYGDLLLRGRPTAVATPEEPILDLPSTCRLLFARLLGLGGRAELGALWADEPAKARRVALFLGVLEMARLGWLSLASRVLWGPVDVVLLARPDAVDVHRAFSPDLR